MFFVGCFDWSYEWEQQREQQNLRREDQIKDAASKASASSYSYRQQRHRRNLGRVESQRRNRKTKTGLARRTESETGSPEERSLLRVKIRIFSRSKQVLPPY